MARTYPKIDDHLTAVVALLDANLPFPVDYWQRPFDANERFDDPPYILVRIFPSAAEFDGPLDDSQADINLRVQLLGVGTNERQALIINDLARPFMQRDLLSITDRSVMDVRLMVASAGVSRDDDLPTPFFYSSDLYEIRTTPSIGN